MKYFEILVVNNQKNSYYEGRFFMESSDKTLAVHKVKELLEITSGNFEFYTKELTATAYYFNLSLANKRKVVKNRILESYFASNNYYNKTTKMVETCKANELEFVDLKSY